MTFSAEKLRITSVAGTGNVLPSIITCGELVDSYLELDVMILQDTSGSYPASESVPFVQNIASCILTGWPNVRLGLAYFADFVDDAPYGEMLPLAVRNLADINTWTLPSQDGGDEYEAQLNAIKSGAESTTFGWRPEVPYRKRVIVLNTDTFPKEYPTEPRPYISKQECIDACISNNVWPIYILTSSYYAPLDQGFNLGYGVSGLGDPSSSANLISQILTGIYNGLVK